MPESIAEWENVKGIATRQVFRDAGVEARWVGQIQNPEQAVSTNLQPFIFLHIIPSNLPHRLGFQNDVMGFAPGKGNTRDLAYVFYDSGEALAGTTITEDQMLGAGNCSRNGAHYCSNLQSHSAGGIMRGACILKICQNAARGGLLFTPTQAKIIRAELARRNGQRRAVVVAGLESPVPIASGLLAKRWIFSSRQQNLERQSDHFVRSRSATQRRNKFGEIFLKVDRQSVMDRGYHKVFTGAIWTIPNASMVDIKPPKLEMPFSKTPSNY